MPVPVLSWLYRKLGRFYPGAYVAAELQTAFAVTAGTLVLFTFYWDVEGSEFWLIFAIAMGTTALAITLNLVRTLPQLRPIAAWIKGERSPDQSARAWAAGAGLPAELVRRDLFLPVVIVVIPSCAAAVAIIGLSWLTFLPLFAGSLVAVGYGGILHYLALEAGMRPMLIDINQAVSPRRVPMRALSLRTRLLAAMPLINLITGLVVAALTSEGGGGADLGVDVLIAVAVATTISLELTVLLSKSIMRPIADLQRATNAVAEGRFDVDVPVTTGDEIGELAASFNAMLAGLAERERLREAFGTYVDREVAEYILSDGFSEHGIELDVSVLFCDARDFTEFAAQAGAKQVVATLNRLFEVIVPIIARHGGHVDKFVGDGLIAVFGAPENYPDHAERAVRAGCEMVAAVNGEDRAGGDLAIGVGINSGTVIAGSVGGAGRLNFSVIGDAVNVASRVEAATRELEDDLLITEETAKRLGDGFDTEDRGGHELKGIAGETGLYAPRIVPPAAAPRSEASTGARGA